MIYCFIFSLSEVILDSSLVLLFNSEVVEFFKGGNDCFLYGNGFSFLKSLRLKVLRSDRRRAIFNDLISEVIVTTGFISFFFFLYTLSTSYSNAFMTFGVS